MDELENDNVVSLGLYSDGEKQLVEPWETVCYILFWPHGSR